MKKNFNIILASASPRRQELLRLILNEFTVCVSNVEEIIPEGLNTAKIPEYLANLKTTDVAKDYSDSVVIGADTCVIIDGEVLGKPHSKDEAVAMLKKLSGKTHKVITGCSIMYGEIKDIFSVETEVEFFCLSESQIEEYVNSDEPYDKAGGYGIQSKGALFVKKINGDYNNVVGFPVAELNRRLENILK